MSWAKTRFPVPEAAHFEADGLAWLAQPGAVRTARVISVQPGKLELEQIASGSPTPASASQFGADLARTHAAGAPRFGYIPGSTPGFMGQAALPPAPQDELTWGEFYATHRVAPFLRTAVSQGRITAGGQGIVEQLIDRLLAGDLDHDQPELVNGVARLHGDLWSGNVLWDSEAEGQAVLIDPTAHGGHAETDLAMLALFGQSHLTEIIEGYQEASPLADGWSERVALHQVNPLLVHTVLFGGSYADAAIAAAGQYL